MKYFKINLMSYYFQKNAILLMTWLTETLKKNPMITCKNYFPQEVNYFLKLFRLENLE